MTGMLIGGTASGVGKTTVALAIMACLRRRGFVVQPYKGGPDFLDTTHHSRIAGRTARNLDTWMLSRESNREVLSRAAVGADAVVVEGMMGLFDGKDGVTEAGSSAEIAKMLKLPVLLVLDCAKSARSVAATVLGFECFDPDLPLAGLILNRVAGLHHYRLLESAIQARCSTPILGWLPRESNIAIPERHLGLHAAGESEISLDTLANLAETHFKVDPILRLDFPLETAGRSPMSNVPRARVGVARDHAFSFYYEDNLDLLREQGAEIIPFSPIADKVLPADLDALYFGGGYPELYARELSANTPMLDQIRAFARSGGHIYAECGGLLYLSQQLSTLDGSVYPMLGILPLKMEMTNKLVDFGYVTVTFTQDCLLGPRGTTIRGHSFHYSRICSNSELTTSYQVDFSLSGKQQWEGFTRGKVLASYVHLHFGANPTVAQHFVGALRGARHKEAATA
ncbi:MAG: cobyrinate a,c-diamide synthase [Acidobacteriaceae bacterium]